MRSRLLRDHARSRRGGSRSSSGSSARARSPARRGSRARTRGCCGCRRRGTRRSTGPGRRRRRRSGARRRGAAAAGTARGSCPGTRRRGRSGSAFCQRLARLGEALEHLDGEHEQVVEVDRVRGEQPLLVALVDVGDGLVVEGRDARARTRPGRRAGSSRSRSARGCRAGRSASGRSSSSSRHALTTPDLVGLVVDREVRAVAEPRAPRGAGCGRRRRGRSGSRCAARCRRATRSSRSRISPAALFVNVIARISFGFTPQRGDQVGDAVGEDARLARAGAGDDEQRALGGEDGLALGRDSGRRGTAPAREDRPPRSDRSARTAVRRVPLAARRPYGPARGARRRTGARRSTSPPRARRS